MLMNAIQASEHLRKGGKLNVELDVAEEALALAVPFLFRYINPVDSDGKGASSRFRALCDNATLPHDHPVYAGWLAIRALRAEKGDAILCQTGCAITEALLRHMGVAQIRTAEGHVLRADRSDPAAISITNEPPVAGEMGAIAAPGGTIRFPNTDVTNLIPEWPQALPAIERISGLVGKRAYDQDPDAVITLKWERPERAVSVDADSIHEDWAPEIAFHADLKPHPSLLIQSATLATVIPPHASYQPKLPRRVISSGRISNAQFDFLVAAGEAHSKHLPLQTENPDEAPMRRGIYLADGTGAGKTNEMLAVALDNILNGHPKAILVLAKRRHLKGFMDAWASFGRNPKDFILQWDHKVEDTIPGNKGILVTTYSALREFEKELGYLRINQIERWAGGRDFGGAMLLDEAQEMRNAAGSEDSSGKDSETSIQGLAGIALQEALPDARVVYGSATGATDVHNLGYAIRLGIWGAGTPFKDRATFIKTFEEGGIADMEQVTLSLKASGIYVARSLSYDGVDVTTLPVSLTAEERRIYNESAEGWTKLQEAMATCRKLCNAPTGEEAAKMRMQKEIQGRIPYSHLNSVFESNRKVSMNTLIAAFKARGVIADAKQRIDEGYSVVIQMQNTYEAQLNRALDSLDDVTDIKLEPAEMLSFAQMLPDIEYQIICEPNPTKPSEIIRHYVPRLDAKGNEIKNPMALALKNQMIAMARSMKLPLPPLDQILMAFGTARVAEVTGRGKRLIPNKPNGARDGSNGVLIEERKEKDRAKDIEDFHGAKKPILIFSTGAGGSSLSYHAKIGTKAANRRRYHYLIQLGHRADEVTQGIGRTHRSDQTMPPIVSLVTVNLPADRLYASRIVSALFKLGALTQGHRHATSNGMFDERDCLDGPYAEKAWGDLQKAIMDDEIKGYDWPKFMQDMGLSLDGMEDKQSWNTRVSSYVLTNINRMINRVAALTDHKQYLIFDKLREFIDKRIESAIADGSFTAGPEVLAAKSLTILSDFQASTDEIHGGGTRILRVRKKTDIKIIPFIEAYRHYLKATKRGKEAFFAKHRTTGKFALITSGKPQVNLFGDRMATYDIYTPEGVSNRLARVVFREPWISFSDMDDTLEAMWTAAVEATSPESTSYLTIVAGALLPVWPALGKASGGRNAVYRFQSDDGTQIVGRPIAAEHYADFCAHLETSSRPDEAEVDDIMDHLKSGKEVALAGRGNHIHILRAEHTGNILTGISLEYGSYKSTALQRVIDALNLTSNTLNGIMTTQGDAAKLRDLVSAILSASPACYVNDGNMMQKQAAQKAKLAAANANAATNPAPASAVQAIAKAA